jgi:predicted flap endonuclease-1-like 5' DNA nuclease
MTELWDAYWPVILVALVIGLITGLLIFRPRQRVTLTKDDTPRRPHMAAASPTDRVEPSQPVPPAVFAPAPRHDNAARHDRDGGGEGDGVGDEAAGAVSDVLGEFLDAPVHGSLPGSRGVPDDLQRMKGVGPKFASLLASQGLTRFEQLAALGDAEIARLDAAMGSFRGRLARDRVVEQAAFLARGDQAGYEAQFGKL